MQACFSCRGSFYVEDVRTIKRCKHSFCCKCLVEYFRVFSIEKLKCLDENCTVKIQDKLLRECLSNNQIKLYEQLSIMKSSQRAIKCLTNGCIFIVLCEQDDIIFECEFCQAPNCVRCRTRHYLNECGNPPITEEAIEARARKALKEKERKEFQELENKYHLIPNPDSFECPICSEFILPRVGAILRNCIHCFCLDCLRQAIQAKKYLSHMTCPIEKCNKNLNQCEIFVIINEDRLVQMINKEAASRFFQCKNGDCDGVWDICSSSTGIIPCPRCHLGNCIDCKDIHEGMACPEFRRTKRYISSQDQYRVLRQKKGVKCVRCTHLLIRKGGCYAMYCDCCGNQTCFFTGKLPGCHIPQKCGCGGTANCKDLNNYCNCTPAAPCDGNCLYGCFPENPT